jgi:hypothetical protein
MTADPAGSFAASLAINAVTSADITPTRDKYPSIPPKMRPGGK